MREGLRDENSRWLKPFNPVFVCDTAMKFS